MSLWYVYSMWWDRLCQRKSISARLPIHCHALYWSPYQNRDPLSNDHRDKMCLYSTSSAPMKMFPQSGPTWTMSKGFIKLTDSPRAAEWIVSQIAACFNRMTAEGVWGRSADLIQKNVMGLSVLGGLCACVCVHTHLSQCLSVCSVCNHSIKSTAITNRISWVDSRSLSLLIDFLWFPSAHQGRTFSEWPRWEWPLRAEVNTLQLMSLGCIKAGTHLSVSGKVK